MGIGVPYIMPISFSIDAVTLGSKYVNENYRGMPRAEDCRLSSIDNLRISVIIPVHNSEKSIENTVRSIYGQDVNFKTVIVVDDCSTDKTPEICRNLEYDINNFFHIKREVRSGKAMNINYIVREFRYLLGDITVVIDSDIALEQGCIREMARDFTSNNVAAVTPYGYTLPPENNFARMLHYGNSWNNEVFKVRKEAQDYRSAISVICGAGSAYRTNVLRQVPIPTRSKTEDTDYTWLLQELGYDIRYEKSAVIYSHDLEKYPSMLRQWHRWYSGTFQNIYLHGKNLGKAKWLCWTTVIPSLIESVPYALGIVTLPVIAALNFAFPGSTGIFGMDYVFGFLLADFLFTIIPTAIISKKYLRRMPEIYVYKFVGSALTLSAFLRVTYEKLMNKQAKWSNKWSGTNDFTREISVRKVTKDYMAKNMQKFLSIEGNWTGIGEIPWTERNFMHELSKKWRLSYSVEHDGAIIGYIIGSQASGQMARVNKIVVDNKYRSKGIGRILLKVFEDECLKNGIAEVELKALVENKAANKFYLGHGYVPVSAAIGTDNKTRNVYRKKLDVIR